VQRHGTRDRKYLSNGIEQICQVQRFLCNNCKKTFTLLPHFLLPFKHYVVSEIEQVLCHVLGGGKISEAPSGASESTLSRWCKEFGEKMVGWAGILEAKFIRLGKPIPSIIQCLSHPFKRLEADLSLLPALPGQWTVITKVLWWLKNSHPL
jgi:transposase-like protein